MSKNPHAHLVGQPVKFDHSAGAVTGKVTKVYGSTLYVLVNAAPGFPAPTVRFNYRAERQRWVQVGRAVGPVLVFTQGVQA